MISNPCFSAAISCLEQGQMTARQAKFSFNRKIFSDQPTQQTLISQTVNQSLYAMEKKLTPGELNSRWERVLAETDRSVKNNPGIYRELKSLAGDVARNPLDITDYLPTAKKFIRLLTILDPRGRGTIFHLVQGNFSPTSVWHAKFLRMECLDLLDHLKAFDQWRLRKSRLRIIK